MASILEMGNNVRLRLGSPLDQRPTDKQLLLAICTHIQTYINRANASAKAWIVDELNLTVAPQTQDYPVGDSSFGKPLTVSTYYPQNASHITRLIEFFELPDMNFDWPFPENFASLVTNFDGAPHTAMRMAFFRKQGSDQVYVRVRPVPALTAVYKVLYQLGSWADRASLASVPILPQHHALIETRTAMTVLPYTEWDGNDLFNSNRRKELALALSVDEKRLTSDFETYITSTTMSRTLSYMNVMSID